MNSKYVLAILLTGAATSSAHADNVYKCKGAAGETIYQSDPCPAGSTPIARGRYDRQPDDPSNNIEAANEAAADNARRENQRRAVNAAAQTDVQNEPPQQSEYERQREARRAQIEAGSYRSRVGDSGPPRENGYPRQPAEPADIAPSRTHPISQQMEAPTDCRGMGGSVTCYDSRGNVSSGRTNTAGSTDVFGTDGTMTTLPSDTCIKDQYGKCQ